MSTPETPIGYAGFMLACSIIIVLGLAGLYDVYAVYFLRPQDTVSWYLRAWSTELPVLPMLIGLVLGHLLFPLPR